MSLHHISVGFVKVVRFHIAKIRRRARIDARALNVIEHNIQQQPMWYNNMPEKSQVAMLRMDSIEQMHEYRCVEYVDDHWNDDQKEADE